MRLKVGNQPTSFVFCLFAETNRMRLSSFDQDSKARRQRASQAKRQTLSFAGLVLADRSPVLGSENA